MNRFGLANVLFSFVLVSATACRNTPDNPEDTGSPWDTGEEVVPEDPEDPLPENLFQVKEDLRWDEDITLGTVWMIPEGITLSIAAGVSVSFLPGAGLIVEGTVLGEGTADEPVRFLSSSQVTAGNYGVSVAGSADASSLNNVVFESIGLRLEGAASAGMSGCAFSDSTLTLLSRSNAFSLNDCHFSENRRDNQTAVYVRDLVSLDVTNSSFENVGYGITYNGTPDSAILTVSDSTFQNVTRAIEAGNVMKAEHQVTLTNLTVQDVSGTAIAVYGTQATLENVSVANTLSHGVYGDRKSTINWQNGSVSGAGQTSVYSAGSLNLNNVTVTNSDSHGVYAGEDGSTLNAMTISDIEGYGIYAYGDLSVSNSAIQSVRSSGIYTAYGDTQISGVSVSEVLGQGIYTIYGSLTAENVSVSEVEGSGLYAHTGNLVVTGATMSGIRTHGLVTYRGSIDVSNTSVSDVENYGIYANDGGVTANTVTIDGIRGFGLYASYGDVNLTDVTVRNISNHGVYVREGNLIANIGTTGVVVEDCDGIGLYANSGTIVAHGLVINRMRSHGIYATYGSATLTNVVIDDVGGYGIYSYKGPLVLENALISNFVNAAAYAYKADASITGVTITAAGERGFYVNNGDLTLSDSTVDGAVYQGVYVNLGDASISDVTISDAGDSGIYVSRGDATLERVRVIDLDGDGFSTLNVGLYVKGKITATDVLVTNASSYGVYAESGDLTDCTLSNNLYAGVYFYGFEKASTVQNCALTGNYTYGVQGRSTGENFIDVTGNNIQDNVNWGVQYVRHMDGNFVSDNRGFVGADTEEEGTLDAVLDAKTDQLQKVDSITGALATAISGAGSTLSAN
jgi:hypothetical protein